MKKTAHRPLVLIILDGFGYSDTIEHNAIKQAHTPCFDRLWQDYPHTLISGSGKGVGLPDDQMGNSEVGHLNLGAGRIVYQEFSRINQAILDSEFFTNPTLVASMQAAKTQGKAVHLLGLASPGGVHSHVDHLIAAIELAAQLKIQHLYLHLFLDGRDTPPQSAMSAIECIEKKCAEMGVGKIASLCGRYYAMDRDKRWERTAKTYRLLTENYADYIVTDAATGLTLAYERGETDEFVQPTLIENAAAILSGDTVIFMNFRADRARQLTQSFIDRNFSYFERFAEPQLAAFVCLTQYDATFNTPVAFPATSLSHIFGACLAEHHLTQLRLAETEKYAHVTFFFNGGTETPFAGEDRQLIPSPSVATYDLQPEMSAIEMTDQLIAAIKSKQYDHIVCNYANADMVGHTGNFEATVQAIECLDRCLERVLTALKNVGGEALITADHGNADCMFDDAIDQPHTAHTKNPVPFIYVGRPATIVKTTGNLADVAPTMLYLMNLPIPTEMTGTSLLEVNSLCD